MHKSGGKNLIPDDSVCALFVRRNEWDFYRYRNVKKNPSSENRKKFSIFHEKKKKKNKLQETPGVQTHLHHLAFSFTENTMYNEINELSDNRRFK